MPGIPSEKIGGQSRADTIQHITECWEVLSPFHKAYYSIKGYFYAMSIDARALIVLAILAVVALVTFVFKVPPFAAVVIVVFSAILGVFAVWLLERPKQ